MIRLIHIYCIHMKSFWTENITNMELKKINHRLEGICHASDKEMCPDSFFLATRRERPIPWPPTRVWYLVLIRLLRVWPNWWVWNGYLMVQKISHFPDYSPWRETGHPVMWLLETHGVLHLRTSCSSLCPVSVSFWIVFSSPMSKSSL